MTTATFPLWITGLILFGFPLTLKAQLFETTELYPDIMMIKGKYYNGTGGGGYWSLDYVDSTGRVISKERYHKKQLMSRNKIVYDDNNNKIYDIQTYDYNNPERVDTCRYAYKYTDNRIKYQFRKISENDSTVIKLIENTGDTLLTYREHVFYYRPNSNTTAVYEKLYTLRYRDNYLISKEVSDKASGSIKINRYEYYDSGRLKRRLIETIPRSEQESVYTGGPGSDDESYTYKLDSEGKILKYFKIINGKKFKIAVYKYEK